MSESKYPKKYFIAGFQVHQAKKVCLYFFGDYFVSIRMNTKEHCFDIKLKKSLKIKGVDTPVTELLDVNDFKSYWGPAWRLLYEVEQEV